MSSFIAYESDNLTIITAKGQYLTGNDPIPTIRLHISLLMNGKIKNLYYEFPISFHSAMAQSTEPNVADLPNEEKIATLTDWTAWNTVIETLHQLGYGQDIREGSMHSFLSGLNY